MSGAMTEFRITSDLSALRSQIIDANFDEVREWLDENLEPYRSMTVTEDAIPQAKAYRANIRKVKDRIEQSRKEAKTAALSAYSAFESKCKELTGLCDEAANAIDEQIKDFENEEKREKIAGLRKAYEAGDDEARAYCPWERIFNPKWENKGYSAETAKAEIEAALTATVCDLDAIRSMGGDDTAYLLDCYRQTHDISAVIRKASEIATVRERETQRRREEEERKKAAEAERARRKAEEETKKSEAMYAPAVTSELSEDELVTVCFKVVCTKAQLTALGQYMRQNGILYGKP